MMYALLKAKILKFDMAAAEEVLRALPGLKCPLHPSFLSSFIVGCTTTRQIDVATSALRFWQQNGGILDATSNDLLLILYYVCKRYDAARELFQSRKFSKLASEAATARTYNLVFLYEMSSPEPNDLVGLLDEMQHLNYPVDPAVVRQLLRKSITDPFETKQALSDVVDELSQVILSILPPSVSSADAISDPISMQKNYTYSKAISDLLPGYGAVGRVLEMAQLWQDRITNPGYYEVSRLIEGYILAGKKHDALNTLNKLMFPLLSRNVVAPWSEISLALIASMVAIESDVSSLSDLLDLWKRFTSLPGFKPSALSFILFFCLFVQSSA